jgi:hypothetical protein
MTTLANCLKFLNRTSQFRFRNIFLALDKNKFDSMRRTGSPRERAYYGDGRSSPERRREESEHAENWPRDEFGRFLSREEAEAEGYELPERGMSPHRNSPRKYHHRGPRQRAYYGDGRSSPERRREESEQAQNQPRDITGRFISYEEAEEEGYEGGRGRYNGGHGYYKGGRGQGAYYGDGRSSPERRREESEHAENWPRNKYGQFLSREEAEDQGYKLPARGMSPRRYSGAGPQRAYYGNGRSSPERRREESEQARRQPRDETGRFISYEEAEEEGYEGGRGGYSGGHYRSTSPRMRP